MLVFCVGLIVGLLIGTLAGLLAGGLCNASADADRQNEAMWARIRSEKEATPDEPD